MALAQTKTPYEFLVRWDDDGNLKGAHIAFVERVVDGTTVLTAKVGDALPVAMAGSEGFPLADALAALNISALADGEAKAAQIAQMEQSHAAGIQQLATDHAAALQQLTDDHAAALQVASDATAAALGERDAARAEVAALTEQLAEYHKPPINGVPQQVTRRQARQALRLRGLLQLVQPAIDAIPDELQRGLMQDEWDDSLNFERQRPSLIAMAHAIGLTTDAQIDDLFVFAASLA